MTKKEQIEEMANNIAKCCPDKVDDGCFDKKMNCVSCIAMELYNAGYRKVPENVILLDFNTESRTASYTVMPRDEFLRNVTTSKEGEKKAVKEFAEKLKKKLFDFFQDNEEIDVKISTGVLYADIIGVDAKDGTIITLGIIDALLKEYEK